MAENKSVGEAVREASAELTARAPAETETREPAARETPDQESEWEGPKWLERWKKPSREAIRKLRKYEGASDLVDPVLKEIEERYDYTGARDAELDRFKKRWEPYDPIVAAIEQRAALHGMPGASALQQLVATQDLLQQNPDQGLAYLAQAFRPRDAKALIQFMAQQYGVDLGGMAQAQPWVDPAVDQRVKAIEEQNRQLMGFLQGQYQTQYAQNATKVAEAIKGFREAKDEGGNLKYPHYERLDPVMTAIFRGMTPQQQQGVTLEALYDAAIWNDPELRQERIKTEAESANRKALEEAARQNATTDRALAASRNVTGSARPQKTTPANLREVIKQESKRLSAKG